MIRIKAIANMGTVRLVSDQTYYAKPQSTYVAELDRIVGNAVRNSRVTAAMLAELELKVEHMVNWHVDLGDIALEGNTVVERWKTEGNVTMVVGEPEKFV